MIRRAIRRLVRPLRLFLLDWQAEKSHADVEHLRWLRAESCRQEGIELRHQLRLAERRERLERQ